MKILQNAGETPEELDMVLSYPTQTKNKWSRIIGYPPEILVFGKLSQSPGSLRSDPDKASHEQKHRKASSSANACCVANKREKHFPLWTIPSRGEEPCTERTRPQKMVFHQGDWTMAWRKENHWLGPLKVIVQEGSNGKQNVSVSA